MRALVIIPTYNEAENIVPMIHTVMGLARPIDLLVVDDSSPDGTADLVRGLQQEYGTERLHLEVRTKKDGLGRAYLHGFAWGLEKGYDILVEMDADFSHPPHDLHKLVEAIASGEADVSVGSRYVTGVNVVNWPMKRVLMSYFASKYVKMITGMPFHDSTAGFVAYSAEVLRTIPLDKIQFVGYAFQIEMKFMAWKYGFKIKEIAIVFTERERGVSKMSVKIFREAVLGVIKLKVQSLFRRYQRPKPELA